MEKLEHKTPKSGYYYKLTNKIVESAARVYHVRYLVPLKSLAVVSYVIKVTSVHKEVSNL